MKNFYKELRYRIQEVLKQENRDDKYIIFTEQCFRENEDKILKMGLVKSDIKIYTIPSNLSVSKLVEEFEHKQEN